MFPNLRRIPQILLVHTNTHYVNYKMTHSKYILPVKDAHSLIEFEEDISETMCIWDPF